MPKRNYRFEKRQKDLAKQKKKEEKALRKLERATAEGEVPSTDATPPAGSDIDVATTE